MHSVLHWNPAAGQMPLLRAMRHSMHAGNCSHALHSHDFFEVFWIEKGRGVHAINGAEDVLGEGDVVFIRDTDTHAFRKTNDKTWTWVNISFSSAVEEELRRRHGAQLPEWPWRKDAPPQRRHLLPYHVARLAEHVAELPNTVRRWLDVDWFLCGLFRLLTPSGLLAGQRHLPEWLEYALEELNVERGAFVNFDRLVARTGRSREHVNRAIRRHFGMTTTALLLHTRLEHAARQLRLTNTDIFTVAQEAGFDNLSYFYRCFRRQYGLAPRKFRMRP